MPLYEKSISLLIYPQPNCRHYHLLIHINCGCSYKLRIFLNCFRLEFRLVYNFHLRLRKFLLFKLSIKVPPNYICLKKYKSNIPPPSMYFNLLLYCGIFVGEIVQSGSTFRKGFGAKLSSIEDSKLQNRYMCR